MKKYKPKPRDTSEDLWGHNLRDFMLAMHGIDIVWLPKDKDDEPNF